MSSSVNIKQVYKGSRSLDFFNNSLKNASHLFSDSPPISSPAKPEKRQIKHLREPVHPFYKPSEIQKLQTVIDVSQKSINSFFTKVQFTDKSKQIVDSIRFGSPSEVFDFFTKYQDSTRLKIVEPEIQDFKVINISDNVKKQLDDVISNDLNEYLSTQFKDGEKIVSTETKLQYFILNHLETYDIDASTYFLIDSVKKLQDIKPAKAIFYQYFNKLDSFSEVRCQSFSHQVDTILNNNDEYFGNVFDNQLVAAAIKTHIKQSKLKKVKSLILAYKSFGLTLQPEIIEQYIIHLSAKENGNRKRVLYDLIGFESVIYTTFNIGIAKELLKVSKHIEEIKSILDLLDSRYSGEEQSVGYKKLEHILIPKILNLKWITSVPSADGSARYFKATKPYLKTELLNRVQKHFELSSESKLQIIEFSVREGSFILASSLLKQMEHILPETYNQLEKLSLERDITIKYGAPGQDEISRRAFINLLSALYINN